MRSFLCILLFVFLSLFTTHQLLAQRSVVTEIEADEVPADVMEVLEQYVSILRNSESIDACAENFEAVAGGRLMTANGLRSSVKPTALTKDFNHVQHYAAPVRITRVQKHTNRKNGYGELELKGTVYKIWIDKKSKDLGVSAPISIIDPHDAAGANTPKVIHIGSL